MTSPILFLIFNRPDSTAVVFDEIRRAAPGKLYIAADAPRADRPGEAELCARAREIATNVDWPCEVKTLFREENLGCRRAVGGAVSWFFEHEPEGIILEDDCLPHPSFFPYCTELLERYRDTDNVMSIGGSCFARRPFLRESYSFTYYADMWGWASWRRAWAKYDADMRSWLRNDAVLDDCLAYHPEAIEYWRRHFGYTIDHKVDSWGYRWIWSVIHAGGLCIAPHRNLISNIGFGADATHTTDSQCTVQYRRLDGVDGPLRHPRLVRRNKSLERDIAIARLGVTRRSYRNRLSGKIRELIMDCTTYSGNLVSRKLVR